MRETNEKILTPEEEVLKEVLGELVREEIQSFPSDEELERLVQPSGEFMARMERAFEEKERKKRRRRVWHRVSAAVASVAAVFGLVLVLNEDVRAFCLPFLRQQDEVMKMTDYRTEKEEEGKKEGEHGKIVGFELTYIPEGFVYNEEESSKENNEYFGVEIYENKEKIMLDFAYVKNGAPSVNNEFADVSTITLENGTICDSYKSNAKGYKSCLVYFKKDIACTLGIDNHMEGWEYDELVKVANGIRTKYEDGTIE